MSAAPRISARFTSAGVPERLDAGDLSIIQYPGSELEAGPHQIWLRRRGHAGRHEALGLLGPSSGGTVDVADDAVVARGVAWGVAWCLWWDQPADGFFGWGLSLGNEGSDTVELDALCTLDVALTPWEELRRNEFYVSQYLDVTPLGHQNATMLAVRQNMPGSVTPWLALTCTRPVAAWCTDALQLAGGTGGKGLDLSTDLPSRKLQHEHTLAGLQSEALVLAPGATTTLGFRAMVVANHPAASSADDVGPVLSALSAAGFVEEPPRSPQNAVMAAPTVFSPVSWVHGEELSSDDFLAITGRDVEQVEFAPDGRPWAYKVGAAHVVAGAKERAVLRPHGHILVASEGPGPHDTATAVTVWMNGTIASQLTRRHADAEPLLSVRRSYLGLTQAEGVRVFVGTDDGWRLLGLPSAWAARSDTAWWWWRWEGRTVMARTTATPSELVMEVVIEGAPVPLLLAARTNDMEDAPEDSLRREGRVKDGGWLTCRGDDGHVELGIPVGGVCETVANSSLLAHIPTLGGAPAAEKLAGFLPWLAQDALIHYQVPRGLEQFTGGAWGTRDVCQGPVGLLVSAGRPDLVEEVLRVVFAAQQDNGDWPQWFEYLPERRGPGHRESHGDVVYWPLLALADHVSMTGDLSILDAEVGWVGATTLQAPSPIRDHVRAALEHILTQRAQDPRLPAYGHGDWNDSLQPADPQLARYMCSTWTAELEIRTFTTLARALAKDDPSLSARLGALSSETESALREHLLCDGELAGYAIVKETGVELLVHPRDTRTGLTHGSLQMIHALADELLTPEEAWAHVGLIDEHLDGPAGIYLFDTPVAYHGGETHMFLRAEAATFWGREIGLMYTHAHLRWVEALLAMGEAERAWEALQLLVPEQLRSAVPGAAPRQSNCYYSSIDAQFTDRQDAEARAGRLFDPAFGFEGGWRVYSSGPGLVLRLVSEGFLGLRWQSTGLIVDPVLPPALDGLVATVTLDGHRVRVRYTHGGTGHGVRAVRVGGHVVDTSAVPRRYRGGGVRIPRDVWASAVARVTPDEMLEMEIDLL